MHISVNMSGLVSSSSGGRPKEGIRSTRVYCVLCEHGINTLIISVCNGFVFSNGCECIYHVCVYTPGALKTRIHFIFDDINFEQDGHTFS